MPRKMKESGVEWLGQIPEGWGLGRVKNDFAHVKSIAGVGAGSYDRLALTMQGVIRRSKDDTVGLQPQEFESYQVLRPNELVFKLIDLQNVKTSRVGRSPFEGIVSPAYIVLHPRSEQNSKYAEYFFLALWMHEIFQTMGGDAVRSCLTATDLLNIPFPHPPLPEQQRIAAFLDERCAKIDGMIAEAKASIEDYKKWKQSIIFEAVTGKHEKNLKPSGVDWIGDVPEGWKVCRLKNVASVFGRIGFRGYTTEDLVAEGDGAISLSPSNLKDMYMDFSKRTYISWAKYEESPEIKVAEGDIVFVKTGSSYGKSCLVRELPEKATLNPQLVVIKNISCNNDFLHYVLQTPFIRYQVELIVSGGTIPTMSQEKMGRFSFVLPSKNVQRRIAAELDGKCAAIDKLVGEKEALIADLEAYKKSLIFETVTGKREVA